MQKQVRRKRRTIREAVKEEPCPGLRQVSWAPPSSKTGRSRDLGSLTRVDGSGNQLGWEDVWELSRLRMYRV